MDSYKNTERLRYRINQDLTEIIEELERNNKDQHNLFVDECFSAIISTIAALFLTQSTFVPIEVFVGKILSWVVKIDIPKEITTIIVVILCLLILIISSIFINKLLLFIKERKRNGEKEGRDTKNYIKEFDNIACDSILVSLEYKQTFNNLINSNEKTLYYLEILHYLEVAIETTQKLCENKNNIKSDSNIFGVYIYRVYNALNIMKELHTFLINEINNLNITSDDKKQIKLQLNDISDLIIKLTSATS